MRRALLASVLTTSLLAGPAAAALAQEADATAADTTTDATTDQATAESTDEAGEEAATPTSVLASLLELLEAALADANAMLDEDGLVDAGDLTQDEVLEEVTTGEVAQGAEDAEDTGLEGADAVTLREALAAFLASLIVEVQVEAALEDAGLAVGDDAALLALDTALTGEADAVDAVAADHGEVVRTVAACAPRGKVAKGLVPGVKNHGQLVRLAAHGETVRVAGVDPASGEEVEAAFDLATLEGAASFCGLLDLVVAADEALDAASDADEADADGEDAEARGRKDRDRGAKAERERGKRDKADRGNGRKG